MEEVKIPNGLSAEVKGAAIIVAGNGKTFEVRFDERAVKVKTENKGEAAHLLFETVGKATKRRVASMRTTMSHVNNAFSGVAADFSKQLQVVYAHFPVSIEVKGSVVNIKNFLGEKLPRLASIVGNTKVEVKGQDITVSGPDKYAVGQTANNLMVATKIRGKDRRVFQDGIYPVA